MEFFIRLNTQPCTLVMPVKATNSYIKITGQDPTKSYTKFFSRSLGSSNKLYSGIKFFNIHLPVSPEVLKITILNKSSKADTALKIYKPEITPLRTKDLWQSANTRKFIRFAINFCAKAGFRPPGVYSSKDKQFHILYSNDIRDKSTNEILYTPARISRISGLIQVSRRKFLEYTLPMRLLILLHEWMHYECKTSEEIEADLNALRIYLALGFPETEAIYATANIFHDSKAMVDRVQQIMNFIYDFNYDEQIRSSNWRASA